MGDNVSSKTVILSIIILLTIFVAGIWFYNRPKNQGKILEHDNLKKSTTAPLPSAKKIVPIRQEVLKTLQAPAPKEEMSAKEGNSLFNTMTVPLPK